MNDEIEDYRAAIAQNVRKARAAAELSQVQLTMRSGIPQTSLSKIEKTGKPFTFPTAYRLAHALGCSVYDLIPETSAEVLADLEAMKG